MVQKKPVNAITARLEQLIDEFAEYHGVSREEYDQIPFEEKAHGIGMSTYGLVDCVIKDYGLNMLEVNYVLSELGYKPEMKEQALKERDETLNRIRENADVIYVMD